MEPRRVAAIGVLALAGAAALALARRGPLVEVHAVARGPIAEWVEATGRVRVRERHVVSAPVPGALERVGVHAGDCVRAGDVVALVRPLMPAPLDERARAELEARAAAARAAEREAQAMLRRARVAEADAARALVRARALLAAAALPARDAEATEAAAAAAAEGVHAAQAALERARRERAAVEALLGRRAAARGEVVALAAPTSGVVLRVLQESPGPVQAGSPILEVGDPLDLEVALEPLTEQASRVRGGARVELGAWGGDAPLAGVVRRVEPSAFTKVSALGVEEQRVLVLVDPAGGREAWAPLGDGWRVEGRVLVAERADALKVPAGSVFREGGWAVFAVEGGRARRREVRLGAASGDEVEILAGLEEGARVIASPSSAVADGARVRAVAR
jgi:HlyD family secretion protein